MNQPTRNDAATSSSTTATRPAERSPTTSAAGWFVVTQVKSNRVVYFTDDPAYQPAMEADWYYVSHFLGELPPGMTPRNCWGWRFNGGVFEDAKDPKPRPTLERLLDSNRTALLGLLREKIDLARAPFVPTCAHGTEVRRQKLEEARAYRAQATGDGPSREFPMLQAVAAARSVPLDEACALVEERHREEQRLLAETERIREQYTHDILRARTQEELLLLRRALLDDVLPPLSIGLAYPAKIYEPREWDAPLSDHHRTHEITRLRIQLREIVNRRRAHVRSQFLEDDTLIRHKARLAQAVLGNGGIAPAGLDCALLANYAKAHQLALADAARLVLGTTNEAEQVLVRTELLKDSLLARVDAIATRRDVHRISLELKALAADDPAAVVSP